MNRHGWRCGLIGAVLVLASSAMVTHAAEKREERPQPAAVPSYNPAKQPTKVGEFVVGVVSIAFRETVPPGSMTVVQASLDTVIGASAESDLGAGHGGSRGHSSGVSQEEYFKIYSNGITWPKIEMMPDAATVYQDPHFYGYYCEYDYWENPFGWQSAEEGAKRVEKMNRDALRFAEKNYRGRKPDVICYNYLTQRPATPEQEVSDRLRYFYENRGADPDRTRKIRTRKVRSRDQRDQTEEFNPWVFYRPAVKWGEPMWPNSKVQINDSAGGVLAHELGHCLGAPDVYRIGRFNDGISGSATMLTYGPTANAFSRFYHHGFIKQANHPVLEKSGIYTLHPRHIDPQGGQAVGYLIPSSHPHYMYHVEYIHNENATVGVGPDVEGMLISAVNLGRENYTGSPDYFYTYRPNDPFFRGGGSIHQCLFGEAHGRTSFGPQSDPPSRLPNLLDGGIRITNIREKQGTLTFDLEMTGDRIRGREYTESMLPQIRLDKITDVQATSFTMDATIKFRGEPIKTDYGFCWSTTRNPTVRDASYNLRHRECYRGHAIHLRPETTYYVRAYATNGIGVRYSDEELTVKTAPLTSAKQGIGPLCTDGFSNNGYLHWRYSNEVDDTSDTFVGYSPTCVLAKLIGYYRPKRFPSASDEGKRAQMVDFDRLNWNPADDFPPYRLDETDGFFQSVYDQCQSLGMHDPKPSRRFLPNLTKLTGVRSKPVLSVLSEQNLPQVARLITQDLARSRPVIVIFCQNTGEITTPPRWALIDGIDASGRLHIDFPLNSKLYIDGDEQIVKSGTMPAEFLILHNYLTHVVTSCHFEK